jgi:catechol 2,3-dioxygenase-like lactoylglutathione lyase family enzyme
VDVLASRVLLHPRDWRRSYRFYREILGLKIYREWRGGTVFFLGGGFLELSGQGGEPIGSTPQLWLQVEDLEREHRRLRNHDVVIAEAPVRKPWGLDEMRIEDPDGLRLVLVEVPPEHPLRRRPS